MLLILNKFSNSVKQRSHITYRHCLTLKAGAVDAYVLQNCKTARNVVKIYFSSYVLYSRIFLFYKARRHWTPISPLPVIHIVMYNMFWGKTAELVCCKLLGSSSLLVSSTDSQCSSGRLVGLYCFSNSHRGGYSCVLKRLL